MLQPRSPLPAAMAGLMPVRFGPDFGRTGSGQEYQTMKIIRIAKAAAVAAIALF
ncbi:hypothetical protein [Ensifer sp. 4252]|uniref:hypothetical protein n=1 Tax=Ensifer sp. 4252 TaxID=3373915 RepID=UPI003D1B095A